MKQILALKIVDLTSENGFSLGQNVTAWKSLNFETFSYAVGLANGSLVLVKIHLEKGRNKAVFNSTTAGK